MSYDISQNMAKSQPPLSHARGPALAIVPGKLGRRVDEPTPLQIVPLQKRLQRTAFPHGLQCRPGQFHRSVTLDRQQRKAELQHQNEEPRGRSHAAELLSNDRLSEKLVAKLLSNGHLSAKLGAELLSNGHLSAKLGAELQITVLR